MHKAFKAKIVSFVFVNDAEDIVFGSESTYVRYEVEVLSSLKGDHPAGSLVYVYSPSVFTCSITTMMRDDVYLIAGRYQATGTVVYRVSKKKQHNRV